MLADPESNRLGSLIVHDREAGALLSRRIGRFGEQHALTIDQVAAGSDGPDQDRHALVQADLQRIGQPYRHIDPGDRRQLDEPLTDRPGCQLEQVDALPHPEPGGQIGAVRERRVLDHEMPVGKDGRGC